MTQSQLFRNIGNDRQMTGEQDAILYDACRFSGRSLARQRSLTSPFAFARDRGDGNGPGVVTGRSIRPG